MLISPFAPKTLPVLPQVPGLAIAAEAVGLKVARGKAAPRDMLLVRLPEGTRVAGRFTTSQTAAAPVRWCREIVARGTARALLVNAGNANAFTGARGEADVIRCAEAVAAQLDCAADEVLVASTGVIGEPLPMDTMMAGITRCAAKLSEATPWLHAAEAIGTTDTYPKLCCEDSGGGRVFGIAKGSGMIAPDLATMLAFLWATGSEASTALQERLTMACATSFEAITVDGDTSTNDTVLAFALPPLEAVVNAPLPASPAPLAAACASLARQVVADGEGISKLITVAVKGAISKGDAKRVAFSIANSPLVKTAIAGQDANWGRVVMAVGKSGARVDPTTLTIAFGDERVASGGARDPDYSETRAAAYLKRPHIDIHVDLGLGQGAFVAYTCDLTHEYIRINADYRS